MGKLLWISAVLVTLVAYYCSMPYPRKLEKWYIRSIGDGLFSSLLTASKSMERIGLVNDGILLYQNITTGIFNSAKHLRSSDERVEVSERTMAGVSVIEFKSKGAKSPGAIVFFHGGGFIVGSVWSHYPLTLKIAAESGLAVYSVDYRLSPTHPYPAAIDDCLHVTVEVFKRSRELGIDSSRIFVAGDSAGGNLAASVAMRLPGDFNLRGILLLFPWLQMANVVLPSYQLQMPYFVGDLGLFLAGYAGLTTYSAEVEEVLMSNSHVPVEYQRQFAKYFDVHNLPENLRIHDMIIAKDTLYPISNFKKPSNFVTREAVTALTTLAIDKGAWPLIADDSELIKLSKIPIFIQYAALDPLRDDAILFAHRMRTLGGNVETNYVRNAVHDDYFLIFLAKIFGTTEAAETAFGKVIYFVKNTAK